MLTCRNGLGHFLGLQVFVVISHLCKHCTAHERVEEDVDDADETCSKVNEIAFFFFSFEKTQMECAF